MSIPNVKQKNAIDSFEDIRIFCVDNADKPANINRWGNKRRGVFEANDLLKDLGTTNKNQIRDRGSRTDVLIR